MHWPFSGIVRSGNIQHQSSISLKLIPPLLLLALLLLSCDDKPVSLNKSLKEDRITRGSITYAVAEKLNAASIWSEEANLSTLISSLLPRADSIELTAETFAPKDNRKRPAIIYIHGGAFVHGSTGVADPTATMVGMEFARRGYRVFSMEYRSMNLFAPSFIKAGYTAAQDGKAAIRYIANHHAELHVDPNQIFLIGYSAGGITALNTAFLDAGEEVLGEEAKLERLYGPLASVGESVATEPTLAGVVSIAGGVLDLAVFDDSPVPLCLIHGEDDEIISPDCKLPFARASTLFSAGMSLLSTSFEDARVRDRIRAAKLDEVCGGAAINDFGKATGMDVEYHSIAGGGHFLMLSPGGEPTEHTKEVLGVVSEFLYSRVE